LILFRLGIFSKLPLSRESLLMAFDAMEKDVTPPPQQMMLATAAQGPAATPAGPVRARFRRWRRGCCEMAEVDANGWCV
jgi:hypothetical protein